VARANLAALDRGSGGCYVIGTGVRTSVNQIYHQLVELTGFQAPVERGPQRPGDARDAQFDATRARSELEWTPETALPDGIRATYEYFERWRALH
jgi:UDP-glucose 4-epimerase